MITFLNDRFVEEHDATLQVTDLAIQRGYGVFDFIRISNNIPLFLADYLERFYNSAAILHLQPPHTKQALTEIIYELISKNNLGEAGVKMILTGGYSADSFTPVAPNLVVMQLPIQIPSPAKFDTGIRVITYEYQRDLPAVKSINYLMGIWLLQKIKAQQAADVLYHRQGIASELPRANVFMVTHDNKIVTPADNILHGITRKKLLQLAAAKYTVEVRDVTIEEIKNAAEVFITSTTKRLLPLTQIDETVIGTGKAGPVVTLLNAAFITMEQKILKQATASF